MRAPGPRRPATPVRECPRIHAGGPLDMLSTLARSALAFAVLSGSAVAAAPDAPPRERLLMDRGWRFAFGHPHDADRDFRHATGYFSYLAKTGFGDGPADPRVRRPRRGDRSTCRTTGRSRCRSRRTAAPATASSRSAATSRRRASAGTGARSTCRSPTSGRRIAIVFDGAYRDSHRVGERLLRRPGAERVPRLPLRPHRLPPVRRAQRDRGPRGRHDGGGLVLRGRRDLPPRLADEDVARARRARRHVRVVRRRGSDRRASPPR